MTGISFDPTDDVARVFIIACKLHVYVGRCQKLRFDSVEAVPPLWLSLTFNSSFGSAVSVDRVLQSELGLITL